MADYITAENLESVVKQNEAIKESIDRELFLLLNQFNIREGVKSEEKLAFKILKQNGLIQLPIENKYWSGAIYFIGDKKIPVINTALPRMNQFFTAWHEVYHLMYEHKNTEGMYEISTDMSSTERKADYFAAKALIGNVYSYYIELNIEDFLDKVACCMDLYRVPYKAVLIQLYEDAKAAGNKELLELIIENFDLKAEDWNIRFRKLGLDEELVTPSYVVNVGYLEDKIREKEKNEPEISAHGLNIQYLKELKEKIAQNMYKGVIADGDRKGKI